MHEIAAKMMDRGRVNAFDYLAVERETNLFQLMILEIYIENI